jgi:ribonuclease J
MTPNDTIVTLTNPYEGTEKMAARTMDIVYHVTSKVKEFSKTLLPTSSANREEIKQMINILKPKYVIPVIGEYRHQYSLRIVANCIGYKDEKIIIADNGNIITFEDGKYLGVTGDVACGELLIDGKAFKDVSDVVMRDRELLANDGVILITANVNPRTKEVIVGPEIISKGFTFAKESETLIQEMKNVFSSVSEKQLQTKFINWSDYKLAIKNEISHLVYKEMKRNPIIIPVLISTDIEAIKQKLEPTE